MGKKHSELVHSYLNHDNNFLQTSGASILFYTKPAFLELLHFRHATVLFFLNVVIFEQKRPLLYPTHQQEQIEFTNLITDSPLVKFED